jgi:four helix bundle protein
MPIQTYRDLEVFKFSYRLALDVSKTARGFPAFEQFEIARQLRRASRSIAANVVEGWSKRSSTAEFKRYLQIAIGSCDECKFWIQLSKDEGYMPEAKYHELLNEFNRLGVMLNRLWTRWRSEGF